MNYQARVAEHPLIVTAKIKHPCNFQSYTPRNAVKISSRLFHTKCHKVDQTSNWSNKENKIPQTRDVIAAVLQVIGIYRVEILPVTSISSSRWNFKYKYFRFNKQHTFISLHLHFSALCWEVSTLFEIQKHKTTKMRESQTQPTQRTQKPKVRRKLNVIRTVSMQMTRLQCSNPWYQL